jgi:hypothetical protein
MAAHKFTGFEQDRFSDSTSPNPLIYNGFHPEMPRCLIYEIAPHSSY